MSDSIWVGMVLAAAGGLMDAYSYLGRGGVFANAQTGNILLLGIQLYTANWNDALRYACPVLAFAAGVALADITRHRARPGRRLHWRQLALALEIAAFCAVGFMPQRLNLAANSLISLACGIQVESFRSINGNNAATTMCIGNLRSATQALCEYGRTKNPRAALRGLLFLGVILCFMLGAILGNVLVAWLGEKAIWVCNLFLAAAAALMCVHRK